MVEITAQMVKELRNKTGAGMGDCKKALVEAEGDINSANEILRKKGAATVAKRADRSANEGLVLSRTSEDGKKAIIVEINSETDFVAKNAEFISFSHIVADALINNAVNNIDELMNVKVGFETLLGLYNEILAKFGEKIQIRRFETINTDGFVTDYVHAGSKLAVLVEANTPNFTDEGKKVLRDIAMQIAAMNPIFVDRSVVTQAHIDKEIEIYTEQAIAEGKKPEIAVKIANGKLDKFYQEQCLVEQTFVKDPSKNINDVVKGISTEMGTDVKIKSFRRYFLGESLD